MGLKRTTRRARTSAAFALAAACAAGAAVRPAAADVFTNVPSSETAGFQIVYDLNIPTAASFNGGTVPYSVDNHANITTPWDRVAYYMELTDASNNTTYAYASMDPFGAGIRRIGIPAAYAGNTLGPVFQKNVTNLNVFSNSPNVTTGTGLAGGNIEFWPNNYNQANGATVPNANASTYDFGDNVTTPVNGYGSFQIHNHSVTATTGQTVIAYNHWGNGGATASDVGIGNRAAADTDYTFAANAGTYTVKRLQVLVHTTPQTFTNPSTLTPLAAGYKTIYALQIPRGGATNGNGPAYQVDRPEAVTNPVSRVGYFLELHKKTDPVGQNQYVFVSMDAFTQNLKQVGVPTTDTGAFFQQNVTNLSVASNVSGVITGTSLGTGNVEFWPSNYTQAKAAGVSPANASDTTFDFGDSGGSTAAGYGSFQIHNAAAGQTILAFNNWGNASSDYDLGIGNSPTGDPDWTFRNNAFNDYDLRSLQVLVLEVPEPSCLGAVGLAGLLLVRRRRRSRLTTGSPA